ncbi:MAG: alpha/beta hydrolase [Candidatus Binatia bacterium]|nr:alpha/beta hydrolase [Candidatus Binatia bacterium]
MSGSLIIGPTSHYFYSQRLKLHYVDWGNHDKPLLVLIHGGRDHCRSWDWVARALRDDYHIIAPDLRGHGDSQWAWGSEYAMIEYVVDIAQLLAQLDSFPVTLIGHSLGGGIVLQYTGVYPERVSKVVAIEGLGPPPHMIQQQPQHAHERMQLWIAQMRQLAGRLPRRYKTLAEAIRRMREANPRLTEEQAYHLTLYGTNRNEDGTYSWKFDNYVRAQSPYRFNVDDAWEIWGRITCPTLLIRGGESWASDPEQDGRAKAFRHATVVTIPKAGHWVHHDQLEHFLRVVRQFLSSAG